MCPKLAYLYNASYIKSESSQDTQGSSRFVCYNILILLLPFSAYIAFLLKSKLKQLYGFWFHNLDSQMHVSYNYIVLCIVSAMADEWIDDGSVGIIIHFIAHLRSTRSDYVHSLGYT